jgi:hypothetical protein
MKGPLRFCFGLHLHQPVGNFDSVFAEHVEMVYRPLFTRLAAHELGPVGVHISGPLLDWLDGSARDVVDLISQEVDAGRIELMAAGHDEPILAVLSRDDRIEQIDRHRRRLISRFGVDVDGLWLTERVWEPDLPADLAAAGIRWTVVDDRHFLSSGFDRSELHRPWVTEFDDQRIHLLAIDQKLRYLVPFRQPDDLAQYLGSLRDAGHQLAVLADDGEKFGGWPGTAEWVWRDGWFTRFAETMQALRRGPRTPRWRGGRSRLSGDGHSMMPRSTRVRQYCAAVTGGTSFTSIPNRIACTRRYRNIRLSRAVRVIPSPSEGISAERSAMTRIGMASSVGSTCRSCARRCGPSWLRLPGFSGTVNHFARTEGTSMRMAWTRSGLLPRTSTR